MQNTISYLKKIVVFSFLQFMNILFVDRIATLDQACDDLRTLHYAWIVSLFADEAT